MGDYKVRPGLNVFDDKGNELDWDYEHDTRFYDDANADEKEKSPVKDVEDAPPLKTGVKVRVSFFLCSLRLQSVSELAELVLVVVWLVSLVMIIVMI